MKISHWLRKTPRPVAVLADEQRIDIPNNRRAFQDLEKTLEALDPNKLTALNAQGDVIRSIVLDTGADDKGPPPSQEMSDLQYFGKLLAEGYEHGRKANQPIIDSAMDFVERQSQRLAKAEAEIERLRAHIHKQHMQLLEISQQPAIAANDEGGILQAMLAGAIQSGALQNVLSGIPTPPPSGGNPVSQIKPGVTKK